MQNKDRAMQAEASPSTIVRKSTASSVTDKEPSQLSDHDLSYSDRDKFSNTSDHSDTIQTKTTVPNTVTTDTSHEYKIATTDAAPISTIMNNAEGEQDDDCEEIPPTEIQYKSTNNSSDSCPHLNSASSIMPEDVQKMTMTSSIDSLTIQQANGWNDITNKTRKATRIKQAVISPTKQTDETYDKNSPSFNKYDPDGSIIRQSNRIKDKLSQEANGRDHKALQQQAEEIRESFLNKLAENRGNEWNLSTKAALHTIMQAESSKKTYARHGQVMKGCTKGSIKHLTIPVPRYGDTLQKKSDREWETVQDDETVFALLLKKNAQQLL
jgi:hypothetical protein